MRRFFDHFRKHPPEEDEDAEVEDTLRDLQERTFANGATQREHLIRLKRKAHRKHMRRQKGR